MDGVIVYKVGVGIQPGSWNAVSVTNAGTGLWDCVFSYNTRTTSADRFLVQAAPTLGSVGYAVGTVSAFGVGTITIRVATYHTLITVTGIADPGGTSKLIDSSFNVYFKELG